MVILPCGGTKLVFNFLYATDISRLKKKELEAYISLSWKTQDLTRAPFTFSCRIELNFILSSCSRGPVLTSAFLFKPPSMYLIFNSRSLIAVFFFFYPSRRMGGILLTEDTNLGFANFQTQVQPSQLFYFPVQPRFLKTLAKHAEIIIPTITKWWSVSSTGQILYLWGLGLRELVI